jgi:hypothetical protein
MTQKSYDILASSFLWKSSEASTEPTKHQIQ